MEGETRDEANKAGEIHKRLEEKAVKMGILHSVLSANAAISAHTLSATTNLQAILLFQQICGQSSERAFLGTVNGEMKISVNYNKAVRSTHGGGSGTNVTGKKRKLDVEVDDATRAVARVRCSGAEAALVSEFAYKTAIDAIAQLLKLRGALGEVVVESWCVSLRKSGEYGSCSGSAANLVVACRLSGGCPIPLQDFTRAISSFSDGLLTTNSVDVTHGSFDLPSTEQGATAAVNGQRSILLLLSVPSKVDQVVKNG